MTVGALMRCASAGVMLVIPSRHRMAWDRFRKYADLAWRQATRWRLPALALRPVAAATASAVSSAAPVAAMAVSPEEVTG